MSDLEPSESLNHESDSHLEQLKPSTTPSIPARPQSRPQKQTTTTTTKVPTDQDSNDKTPLEKPQDELDQLAHEIEKVLTDPVIPPRPQHGSSAKPNETQTEHKEQDFGSAHPVIPSRPTNKKETIETEMVDQNNGLESKSDSTANKESLENQVPIDEDSTHVKPSIPNVPSRPQNRDLDSSEVDNTKASTTPSIPARPQRQTAPTQNEHKPQVSNTPVIPTRPQTKTEKLHLNEELDKLDGESSSKNQENKRHTDDNNTSKPIYEAESIVPPEEKEGETANKQALPTTSTDPPAEPTASTRGFRLPLHMQQSSGPISTSTPVTGSEAELNSLDNSNTFGDGEITPGNSDTKATFKSDEDVENNNRTDSSSFDDDMETISQDQEDREEDRRHRQETTTGENVQESEDPQFETTIIESGEIEERDGDDTDSGELYSEQQQNKEKEDVVPATSTPKIPQRPPKKQSLSRATTDDSLTSLDNTSKPPKPVVPKRPTSEESSSNLEPTIPTRPSIKKAPSIGESDPEPIVPNRPGNKELESIPRDTQTSIKSKPPPPKPKKLSSKIAAFQQQLFNPMNASSEEDVGSTGSKQPEPGIRKRSTENSILSRFGGKAIPLPGMFNPNQMPKPSISHGEETSDDKEEKEEKEENVTANVPVRRTRGPRGKKLPKAVADAEIKTESRFTIESGKLWSLEFKREIKEEKEIGHSDLEKSKILVDDVEADGDGEEKAAENEVIESQENTIGDKLEHNDVVNIASAAADIDNDGDVDDDDDDDVPPEVNERFIKDEEISNVGIERTIASETTTEKHSTDEEVEEEEEELEVDSVDIPIRRVTVNTVDTIEDQKDVDDEPL
ncbi:conserved hypothetical protein [Candida dubliniensis CD36]|uniref:Altered inheritance of mitochondria protein 21 n=1 Tax=Candida dubliniensis (strain CD36 / ATCC MYA-646 / CBS 7987 / NCPF 3949 / NRRL Y-17841) TaxID=573826 RepID=AIM21_CANDC|nr:conserved hypothetical protein [Candida dubliniensis CD36]B9W923.1 RecName: Full=Altered inheritance of mitochondria protein 21 [Candida dubliniensis CD36]CAX45248.1 conserved hypothetical protein [Candida dubliniensis CD36]